MKLYELRRGELFTLKERPQIPPEAYNPITLDQVYMLNNVDGMYSNVSDQEGNTYHFAAWTEVRELNELI